MTSQPHQHPRNRATDRGYFARMVYVLNLWSGPLLVLLAFALIVVSVVVARDQVSSGRTARLACERTQVIGPPLADFYGRVGALSDRQLAFYRSTIPTDCT